MSAGWTYRPAVLAALLALLASCDSVLPEEAGVLVVETFLVAGQPLPTVRVDRTVAFGTSEAEAAVSGASVSVTLDDHTAGYEELRPGWYGPNRDAVSSRIRAGALFRVRVQVGAEEATASGRIPPSIRLDSVAISVPDFPVAAVLLDSLLSPIDSLQFVLPSQRGYIYPVVVSVWWGEAADAVSQLGDPFWVETRLDPVSAFSSTLVDFFLRPRAVLEESRVSIERGSLRVWRGVYAVPVENADDPLPSHDLRVAVVRGEIDFARFALSRDAPNVREPLGNVTGGLGIAAGVAIDSLRIRVP